MQLRDISPPAFTYMCCAILLCICALGYAHDAMRAKAFLRESLGSALPSAHLDVDSASLRQLRNAYELELVRTSPILDLTGTDPQALRMQTEALRTVQLSLAKRQTDPADERAIQSLYPIDYLLALSDLESLHQKAIVSGDARTMRAYRAAQFMAVQKGIRAIRAFRDEFERYAGANNEKYPTLGGTFTPDSMRGVINDIEHGFRTTHAEILKRSACTHGNASSCHPDTMRIPEAQSDLAGSSDISISYDASEIRSLLREAFHAPDFDAVQEVSLESSVCLQSVRGPYNFLPSVTENSRSVYYSQNLFFIPTIGVNAPVMNYFRDELGIQYVRANPSIFYVCPDAGRDEARVAATIRTSQFAAGNRELASADADKLLHASVVSDVDARGYLRSALENPSASAAEIRSLEGLSLMFQNSGAALEETVANIVQVHAGNMRLADAGIPYDLSAKSMFLTHSAFPTLFQSYNPSFGSSGVPLKSQDEDITRLLLKRQRAYSSLIETVPRATIIHDLRTFYDFEFGHR